jgi:heptosyltransferase-2
MNILLVRPDGIGDQILCLPVASEIRRRMPDATIGFLSSAYAAQIFQHHRDVDRVLTLTGRERWTDLVQVFSGQWDAAIFLKPFFRLMLAAFTARVPIRVATGYRWYSMLANRRVYEHRKDFSKHESAYNLGLLRGLGFEPGLPIAPMLSVTEAEQSWAKVRLESMPKRRIVVHPGGFTARPWKLEQYRDLVQRLIRAGYGVVLTGSAEERDAMWAGVNDRYADGPTLLNLMGEINLRELMAVISICRGVISGSTGPAHIAGALGVATVTLFDPRRNMLPVRWKPYGTNVSLRPDVPTCERCVYEVCPYWDCMELITVDQVMAAIDQVVGHPNLPMVSHA